MTKAAVLLGVSIGMEDDRVDGATGTQMGLEIAGPRQSRTRQGGCESS